MPDFLILTIFATPIFGYFIFERVHIHLFSYLATLINNLNIGFDSATNILFLVLFSFQSSQQKQIYMKYVISENCFSVLNSWFCGVH